MGPYGCHHTNQKPTKANTYTSTQCTQVHIHINVQEQTQTTSLTAKLLYLGSTQKETATHYSYKKTTLSPFNIPLLFVVQENLTSKLDWIG